MLEGIIDVDVAAFAADDHGDFGLPIDALGVGG